jgi:signal transduction histidine kinase
MEAKGLSFKLNISRVTLQRLNHDLLFQLIYNLVNNAIRYNKEGGEISITDHLTRGKSYSLYIKDTGIGIPENEIGSIFDRFKKTGRNEGEGYGLGLSIVKSIAQYHGIRIEVKSDFSKGTVFSVIFPGSMQLLI